METTTITGIRSGRMFITYSFAIVLSGLGFTALHYFAGLPLEALTDLSIPIFPILFFIVFTFFLLSVLKFVDRKPLLILSDCGISLRKSGLPFSELEEIPWNDISSYAAKKTRSFKGGGFYTLIVERKSIE